jgi:hypothetical protein
MGLLDLFEEIIDWVTDSFFDTEDKRRIPPQGPAANSAMSTSAGAAQQAYWEKTSQLITPEFIEGLCRETGWSNLKVSMKMQGPCSEVLQRWQRVGRPITDIDLKTMRQEIREKVLRG